MITVESAIEIILQSIKPLEFEKVGILNSIGRALAENVYASRPNPPWDNSAMDGYALRAADTIGASERNPAVLNVIYDLPAGQVPGPPVGSGQAVRIMTGAPVPEGCDAVVMVERTRSHSPGSVLICAQAARGENIRRCGEDFGFGDKVLCSGIIIRPAEVGMLAALGAPEVSVYRKPRVAIFSTGDELVDINEIPLKGKISNSNGYALSALVADSCAISVPLGIAGDTVASIREKFIEAQKAGVDCIISSGGVSAGDYDLVKEVLRELGTDMAFWKVAMKPGKPIAFGTIGGKPVFGLPGNPVSSMTVFEQFVRPSLLKMAGHTDIFRRVFSAILTGDISVDPGRMNLVRGEFKAEGHGFSVTPYNSQGSNLISSMVHANSFIIIPKGVAGFPKGATVDVQPFDCSMLSTRKYKHHETGFA